jgi:hypothetical protein
MLIEHVFINFHKILITVFKSVIFEFFTNPSRDIEEYREVVNPASIMLARSFCRHVFMGSVEYNNRTTEPKTRWMDEAKKLDDHDHWLFVEHYYNKVYMKWVRMLDEEGFDDTWTYDSEHSYMNEYDNIAQQPRVIFTRLLACCITENVFPSLTKKFVTGKDASGVPQLPIFVLRDHQSFRDGKWRRRYNKDRKDDVKTGDRNGYEAYAIGNSLTPFLNEKGHTFTDAPYYLVFRNYHDQTLLDVEEELEFTEYEGYVYVLRSIESSLTYLSDIPRANYWGRIIIPARGPNMSKAKQLQIKYDILAEPMSVCRYEISHCIFSKQNDGSWEANAGDGTIFRIEGIHSYSRHFAKCVKELYYERMDRSSYCKGSV